MEAAEHIRQNDDNLSDEEIANRGLDSSKCSEEKHVKSPSTSSDTGKLKNTLKTKDSEKELLEIGERPAKIVKVKCLKETTEMIKSESVANLRAKAKEHSAKLMGDISVKEESDDVKNNDEV